MGATGSDARPGRLAALVLLSALLACQKEPGPAAPVAPEPEAPLPSPTVHFEQLRAYLPDKLAGYQLRGDEGSTGRYGEVTISEAERTFVDPQGRELKLRIVDTTLSRRIGQAIRAAADDASHKGPGDPGAPIAPLAGTVGFVRYDPGAEKAEANLLVGDRFVVAVTSLGMESTSEVRRVTRFVNLAGLASLR